MMAIGMRSSRADLGTSYFRWRVAAGLSFFALITISAFYFSQSSFDILGFLGIAQVLIILAYLSVSDVLKGFFPALPRATGRAQTAAKIAVLAVSVWMFATAIAFLLNSNWRTYGVLSLCISVVFASAAYPTPLTLWRVGLISVSLIGGLVYAFLFNML